jgi:hypothetical protein
MPGARRGNHRSGAGRTNNFALEQSQRLSDERIVQLRQQIVGNVLIVFSRTGFRRFRRFRRFFAGFAQVNYPACAFVSLKGDPGACSAAICQRSHTFLGDRTSDGIRIASQTAQSLSLALSRLAARRVSIHPRKQRTASIHQLANRVRFGSRAFPSFHYLVIAGKV